MKIILLITCILFFTSCEKYDLECYKDNELVLKREIKEGILHLGSSDVSDTCIIRVKRYKGKTK